MRVRRASGFTLIELMIVVAIIGILASVALPAYEHVTLRAKGAERALMLVSIKRNVEDVYLRYGHMAAPAAPDVAIAFAVGPANPPGPPTTTKRAFQRNLGQWPLVFPNDTLPNGNLFYSYLYFTLDAGGVTMLYVQAQGDLDGDGLVATKFTTYQRTEASFVEVPAASGEDVDRF